MLKTLLLVSTILLFGFAGTPSPRPVQDAAPGPDHSNTKNPVRPTAESQAKAKKAYGYDCEMCHGANGNGKTDLAKDMGMTLTDLSEAKTLAGKSDGQLFDLIRNGKDKMPPEEAARAKDDDIWNLVIYVRGLGK
jgi:cytochrome c5